MSQTALRAAVCSNTNTRVIRAIGVLGFALATALGAQIVVPLPHTPVPITAQTLVVLIAGVSLGARHGAAAMALYLLLGGVGYHAFHAGSWGLCVIAGPTGGYLLGFLAAQPVLGALTRPSAGRTPRWPALLGALLAGHAIIFACGLAWLGVWSGASLGRTLAMGLWPFLPGAVVKTAVALAFGLTAGRSIRRWYE